MGLPFLNFILDSIDSIRRDSINKLLRPTRLDAINDLEMWFEKMLPGRKAVAVSSGRFGLSVLLEHLAHTSKTHKPNVIIPGFSCVVVSNAVQAAGCEVRYGDISHDTLNITLDAALKLIDTNTIAIVVHHVFGLIDMGTIENLRADFPSIFIIEDCAHSLGGKYPNGEFIGSAGDYAFYSFEQSKIVTSWTGGVVVGKDKAAIQSVRSAHHKCKPPSRRTDLRLFTKLASHYWAYRKSAGSIKRFFLRVLGKILRYELSIDLDERQGLFKPYCLTQFSACQAACVLDQLKSLNANLAHRRQLAEIYMSALDSKFVISPGSAVLRFPLWVSDKQAMIQRCRAQGVTIGDWFSTPVHPCDPEIPSLSYPIGNCPHAEEMAQHLVNLPTALQLNVDDAKRIIQTILSVDPDLAKKNLSHV